MSSDTDSGMVTIISVRFESKSLLGKYIYGYLEKKSETPREWSRINMKSVQLHSTW